MGRKMATRLIDTPKAQAKRARLNARRVATLTQDAAEVALVPEVPTDVEAGAPLGVADLEAINRHLAGETRPAAYRAAFGVATNCPTARTRAAAFFARPEVQAALAAAIAHGMRDGLEGREAYVADQHALVEEARRAGQYGAVMSGRATLARVLGLDQGVPVLGAHRGASDQELLLQLRVALGPAVAEAAARELLGDGGEV